jgi:hypothetical protein
MSECLEKERAQCLPLADTLNPGFRLRPDQVWPTLGDSNQAEGHHIIGHGRICATSEPACGRFLKCVLDLTMGHEIANMPGLKVAHVFEARIQRTGDQFGIEHGKDGPE